MAGGAGHVHGTQERASCCASSRSGRRGSTPRGASTCASSTSPAEIRATPLEAVVVRRNEIVQDDRGLLRARATDAPSETIECGLVLRSVGYQAVPLPGVPFDERAFVLPNERGRVLDAPGVYTVGWIKRGPTGILGTNKRDAEETIACLAEDLRGGAAAASRRRASRSTRCSPSARSDVVTVEGWRAIDGRELEAGRGAHRPRVKLASREELLAAAG